MLVFFPLLTRTTVNENNVCVMDCTISWSHSSWFSFRRFPTALGVQYFQTLVESKLLIPNTEFLPLRNNIRKGQEGPGPRQPGGAGTCGSAQASTVHIWASARGTLRPTRPGPPRGAHRRLHAGTITTPRDTLRPARPRAPRGVLLGHHRPRAVGSPHMALLSRSPPS